VTWQRISMLAKLPACYAISLEYVSFPTGIGIAMKLRRICCFSVCYFRESTAKPSTSGTSGKQTRINGEYRAIATLLVQQLPSMPFIESRGALL